MSVTAVVTADSGPDIATTAKTFTGLASIKFEPDKGTFTLTYSDETFRTYSTNGVTACTVSISGTTWTVTIS